MRKIKVYFCILLYSLLKKLGRMIYTETEVKGVTDVLKGNVFDTGLLRVISVVKDNDDINTLFYTMTFGDGSIFKISLGVNQSGFNVWSEGTNIKDTTLLYEIFKKIENFKGTLSMLFKIIQQNKGFK